MTGDCRRGTRTHEASARGAAGIESRRPGGPCPARAMSEKTTARLFTRMNAIYGHLWSSRFASDEQLAAAQAEWARALGRYDLANIGAAIDRCRKHHPTHAPTLGEFERIVRAAASAAQPYCKRLPFRRSAEMRRQGIDALARMKAIVHGTGGQPA